MTLGPKNKSKRRRAGEWGAEKRSASSVRQRQATVESLLDTQDLEIRIELVRYRPKEGLQTLSSMQSRISLHSTRLNTLNRLSHFLRTTTLTKSTSWLSKNRTSCRSTCTSLKITTCPWSSSGRRTSSKQRLSVRNLKWSKRKRPRKSPIWKVLSRKTKPALTRSQEKSRRLKFKPRRAVRTWWIEEGTSASAPRSPFVATCTTKSVPKRLINQLTRLCSWSRLRATSTASSSSWSWRGSLMPSRCKSTSGILEASPRLRRKMSKQRSWDFYKKKKHAATSRIRTRRDSFRAFASLSCAQRSPRLRAQRSRRCTFQRSRWTSSVTWPWIWMRKIKKNERLLKLETETTSDTKRDCPTEHKLTIRL